LKLNIKALRLKEQGGELKLNIKALRWHII